MDPIEARAVLAAISEAVETQARFALATIVSVEGSTYRRPGARLLIVEGRPAIGNLSGGCLEDEVEQLAEQVMISGSPRLERYDLTADDEAIWGWGLGCNGMIDVFIEPGDHAATIADALRTTLHEGRSIALATVVESRTRRVDVGARLTLVNGETNGTLGAPGLDEASRELLEGALELATNQLRSVVTSEGTVSVFVEVFRPPPMLLVCGAGSDAIPVVRMASQLGWETIVIDHRERLLTEERFPEASSLARAVPDALATSVVPERAFAIVMSHNFALDRAYVGALLETPVGHIGILGPRERTRRLLRQLAEEGLELSEEDRSRIHGPAGLDLGGEGPEEVAVSIIAEVLASSNARGGGHLRNRSAPIHEVPTG